MLFIFCAILLLIDFGESKWSKGVIHYAINKKDYDFHSQDIIASTFEQLQKEICLKFFNTPLNTTSTDEKILYISNSDKRKNCPPEGYDFNKTVVDMPIGYKCLNNVNISKIVLDMLKASIDPANNKLSSNDLIRTFQNQKEDGETLLSLRDRNYINANYLEECGDLIQKPVNARRSHGLAMELTAENERYYEDKLWPLGIVMYGIDDKLMHTPAFPILQNAMTTIEMATCVVFQHISWEEPLQPKNVVWFGLEGEEIPHLGFMKGNQTVLMSGMVSGAPGHNAHTLNLLMRIMGIPMMSNRYDRTNYVTINWGNVAKMKEHYLERTPKEAWIMNTDGEGSPYDFDSVTHAPANFMCADCSLGQQTVEPIQDHLWHRTLTMGHTTELSPADIEMVKLLYSRQCQLRLLSI